MAAINRVVCDPSEWLLRWACMQHMEVMPSGGDEVYCCCSVVVHATARGHGCECSTASLQLCTGCLLSLGCAHRAEL
jgi:hypothetical protein